MTALLLILLGLVAFGIPVTYSVTGMVFSRFMGLCFALGELSVTCLCVAVIFVVHPGAGHTAATVLTVIAGLFTALIAAVAFAAGEN